MKSSTTSPVTTQRKKEWIITASDLAKALLPEAPFSIAVAHLFMGKWDIPNEVNEVWWDFDNNMHLRIKRSGQKKI